jgi:hypothetical protein
MKRSREEPTVVVTADAHKRARPSSDEEEELPYGLGSIVTTRRIERTYGGCAMDEAKSAVQKYSRRDEFDKALKFAIEMDLFSLHPDGRHIQTNLWNRFKIIALEDVSLANVNALIRIDARLRCLEEGRKRRRDANGGREPAGLASPTEQQALVDIVWALCTSKHCRLPSHYNAAFCKPEVLPALAAEAPEIHRQLEVARGAVECPPPRRTFPFSEEEKRDTELVGIVNRLVYCLEQRWGAGFAPLQELMARKTGPTKHMKSTNTVYLALDVFDWFVRKAHPDWVAGNDKGILLDFLGVMVRWCKYMAANKEGPPLCLRSAYLALILSDRVQWKRAVAVPPADFDAGQAYQRHLDLEVDLSIDECAIDMHTRRGRSAGKGKEVFGAEGSVVANEDTDLVDPLYKRLYLLTKGIGSLPLPPSPSPVPTAPPLPVASDDTEVGLFNLVVRAQLVTSSSKQDTYFATMKRASGCFVDGQRVFVKGPFPSCGANTARMAVLLNSLKQRLPGLHHQEMCVLDLVPAPRLDDFDQPLGFRKGMPPGRGLPYSFLVCADLIGQGEAEGEDTPIPVKVRSSKCWPPTRVADFEALARQGALRVALPSNLPDDVVIQFVLALCFRHVFQIPDCAERNFVYAPTAERVYSVDEDATTLGRGEPPRGDRLVRNPTQRQFVQRHVRDDGRLAAVVERLEEWSKLLDEDAEVGALLARLPAHEQVTTNLRNLIDSKLQSALAQPQAS